ncbi:MAG: hypothetical protein ACK5PD_09960, partial [Pirellulaceae bacterium]
MQNAESRNSRRSRFTSVLASFEAKISAPRAKLSSNNLKTLALWNAKNPGKTSFSVFAPRYSPVDVPRVDLSIGAALLTSSELVFGTFNG